MVYKANLELQYYLARQHMLSSTNTHTLCFNASQLICPNLISGSLDFFNQPMLMGNQKLLVLSHFICLVCNSYDMCMQLQRVEVIT